MRRYWLHRISAEYSVSHKLLTKGYLTLGWSQFSKTGILDASREDSVIVTVGDIYTILYEYILKHENKILINQGRHLEIRTDSGIRYMRSFVFAEGRKHITVMETYHPATLGRNRFQWNDLSIFRNNQS